MTEAEIQNKAKEAVGSWMRGEPLLWGNQPEDSTNWTIIHTRHRDSEALDRANARSIERQFQPFTVGEDSDAKILRFTHWAVGWVDAVAVRVYGHDGQVTPAFKKLCEINERYAQYPVLDDQDLAEEEEEDD